MTAFAHLPLRLASYNIRAGLGTDLRRDPLRVLAAIRALNADVVALQEADHRLGKRPSALPTDAIEDHTGLVPVTLENDSASLGWHGIALLARPSLRVDDVHRFSLPGLEPRGAIAVDLADLRIVGVHLGLLRHSRRRQLDHLRHALGALPERPTVILGDFNEWSRKTGLGRLARDYTVLTPGRTFPASLPVAALDRIAHCDRLKVTPLPVPRATKGPHPSDHLPVLADVSLDPDRSHLAPNTSG